ncbi:endospore germination permease [Paenibacillus thailandensis]|uniref:Endospore germination permease n=1 Tax=Paenibacillus thailandensis TaxID=393250 RepID=A0ABW5QUX2_9BACL
MNKDARASEIAVTLALFEVGSSPLFLLGGEAKQDAWLAMLLAAAAGFVLLLLYLRIYRLDPDKDLYELCLRYLGKIPGWFAGFAFAAYFAYESSRNLRDLGELAHVTLLNQTPMSVMLLMAIAVPAIVTSYGPKALFRSCMIYFYMLAIAYALIFATIPLTGLLHIEFMFPVLENGLKPVWDAAFPELVSFPFGQTVLFLTLFKYAPKGKNLSTVVLIAYAFVAVFLTVLNQIVILVLNPQIAKITTYPLYAVVQLIETVRIVERADALFTLILFIGLGIKMALFYMCAAIGLQKLTGVRYRIWLIPLAAAVFGLTFLSPTYTEFIWVGLHLMLVYVDPYFQIALPLLLLVMMLIRRKRLQAK